MKKSSPKNGNLDYRLSSTGLFTQGFTGNGGDVETVAGSSLPQQAFVGTAREVIVFLFKNQTTTAFEVVSSWPSAILGFFYRCAVCARHKPTAGTPTLGL